MAKFGTDQIRNVAVLGHGGSGKTSLLEALLHKTGAISRAGRVEDGSTASDWDPEEQRRGISINLSVIPVEHDRTKINLLDTPGYLDFVGEVISALHVAEGCLLLVDAVAGVEVGTELAWDRLSGLEKPRIIFVNKMDRENANFQNAVESITNAFSGTTVLPLQLPIGEAENFQGVVNLANMRAYVGPEGKEEDIPADMMDAAEEARIELVEAAAEADDELIMKYLDGEELTPDEVRHGLAQGIKNAAITPIYCGTATGNIGLERLMSALIRYIPSPAERTIEATEKGDEIVLECDANGPVAAAVFKTEIDRFVGRKNYLRLFSGTINKDNRLANSRTGEESRIANLFSVTGKELKNISSAVAGDIAVITKVDDVSTGDTLSTAAKPIAVPAAPYLSPLYSVAVSPATKADSAKLGQGLNSLTEEDPTLKVETIATTKQTVLQGMGDTHVDVAIRRLSEKFGVAVDTSVPKVPYQETIGRTGDARYRHKKQSGGAGQFAEVHMRVEPRDRGDGFEFASEIFGGSISSTYFSSIEKGIKQVMEQGVVAGYPVVDVKAIIYDGKEHPVDSKDIAFQTAGREVFKLAVQDANPSLLEPIYKIEVTVPEEYMGDVMGDFNTRRGRVLGMETINNRSIVQAEVPLAEIMRYGTDLRSMTQGRGVYKIEFDHYEPVPSHLIDKIVSESQQEDEQD